MSNLSNDTGVFGMVERDKIFSFSVKLKEKCSHSCDVQENFLLPTL